MNNGTKIFIALLLLVGILFVVGLNIGALHSDDQQYQEPGWVKGFGDVLAHSQTLQLADLSPTPPNCLQQENFVIQAGQPCTFSIKKAILGRRVVHLQLLQGASAKVSLSQEDTLTVQHTFPTDTAMDDLQVYPGKDHAMLVIECTNVGNAPACLLGLQS